MKKVVGPGIFYVLLFSAITSCSPKYGIYDADAYFRQSYRGTQQVDDTNQPVGSPTIKENLIFIETADRKTLPVFTTAWVDGKPYSVRVVEAQPGVTIGTLKDESKEVTLQPAEGRRMWQLVLSDTTGIKPDSLAREVISQNAVVLTGAWKGKPFSYKIKGKEQLESLMYP